MMPADDASLFILDTSGGAGDTFVATDYARGPWDPRSCHGGPVSALLTRACEQADAADTIGAPSPWQLARITVELTRPVPVLTPLTLRTEIERPGRNVSMIGALITLADGTEVARARALRIRDADVPITSEYTLEPPFSAPGTGTPSQTDWASGQIAFHHDSVDMRFAEGSFGSGVVSLWCRLLVPVLPDETPSGPQRAASTADFSNGVSGELDAEQMIFINPDLTVHLLRVPQGEWIGMQARSHYGGRGAGLAEGALFDEFGRCGRSVQSLFLAPR